MSKVAFYMPLLRHAVGLDAHLAKDKYTNRLLPWKVSQVSSRQEKDLRCRKAQNSGQDQCKMTQKTTQTDTRRDFDDTERDQMSVEDQPSDSQNLRDKGCRSSLSWQPRKIFWGNKAAIGAMTDIAAPFRTHQLNPCFKFRLNAAFKGIQTISQSFRIHQNLSEP
jgi:hypothetical protein